VFSTHYLQITFVIRMRITIATKVLFLLLFASSLELVAKQSDFQHNFNIAKQHLSQRRILKAIPYLHYLQEKYPDNSNLKYLIGLCYVEEEIVNPKSVQLLTEASQKMSFEYNPNSLAEERVPIYVYYYLSIAHAQNGECESAENARNKFLKIYYHNDQYYVEESMKWLKKCSKSKGQISQDSIPVFPTFEPYVSPKKVAQPKLISQNNPEKEVSPAADKVDKKIITKSVEFTTKYPLFGVQLGAFHEVVPVSRFNDLKNVDAFMDTSGLIRYVIGHFSYRSQAVTLLKAIKAKGYPDAFIVDVNNARKFSDEVISVNDINIKASLGNRITYHVQIGAYKEEIPNKTVWLYCNVEGLRERKQDDITFLTVGSFKSYEEAKEEESKVIESGIRDAFVVALLNGKKISLQLAKDFN